jgi:hypothetical protein
MNQAGPSCGWKARRQAVHSVAAQRKASTTTDAKSSWPQRILVADMRKAEARSEATFNDNLLAVVTLRTVA